MGIGVSWGTPDEFNDESGLVSTLSPSGSDALKVRRRGCMIEANCSRSPSEGEVVELSGFIKGSVPGDNDFLVGRIKHPICLCRFVIPEKHHWFGSRLQLVSPCLVDVGIRYTSESAQVRDCRF